MGFAIQLFIVVALSELAACWMAFVMSYEAKNANPPRTQRSFRAFYFRCWLVLNGVIALHMLGWLLFCRLRPCPFTDA